MLIKCYNCSDMAHTTYSYDTAFAPNGSYYVSRFAGGRTPEPLRTSEDQQIIDRHDARERRGRLAAGFLALSAVVAGVVCFGLNAVNIHDRGSTPFPTTPVDDVQNGYDSWLPQYGDEFGGRQLQPETFDR
jgi:hypothetical protein